MDKAQLIAAILEKLADEFETRRRSSKQTRAEGNHEESKAESKYDTLAIEENYLADGFAKQALAAAQAGAVLGKMALPDFTEADAIDAGAVVELDFGDSREWFFLAPTGGGTEVAHDGKVITVVTPESPLGSRLMGRRTGDRIEAPAARIVRVN